MSFWPFLVFLSLYGPKCMGRKSGPISGTLVLEVCNLSSQSTISMKNWNPNGENENHASAQQPLRVARWSRNDGS